MIILEDIASPGGRLRVVRRLFDNSTLLQLDHLQHSRIDDKGESTFLYIHLMRNLARLQNSKSAVVLGGGGGTLATMLHNHGTGVVQVDIEPTMFQVAKTHFGLPDAVECIVADARDYLLKCERRFDAIFLDAFDEQGRIPRHLTNTEFFETAARCLQPNGFIAVNTIVNSRSDGYADRIAAAISANGLRSALFKDPDRLFNNVVVVGGNIPSAVLALGDEPPVIRKRLLKIRASQPKPAVAFTGQP